MLIWSGRGWLVAVIAFGCLLTSEVVTEGLLRDHGYYQQHGWPKLIGFVAAAVILWVTRTFGVFAQRGRVVVDKQTGEELKLAPRHALFFVPVKYWPFILAGLGVLFLFVGRD